MIDYETIIKGFEEKNEKRKNYSIYLLQGLTQHNNGEKINVVVANLRTVPTIYVKNNFLSLPQPVFI